MAEELVMEVVAWCRLRSRGGGGWVSSVRRPSMMGSHAGCMGVEDVAERVRGHGCCGGAGKRRRERERFVFLG